MSSTLRNLAGRLMDSYYQNYRKDDDFFRLSDFQYYAAITYAKLMVDDYTLAKLENKQSTGFSFVSVSNDVLTTMELEAVEDKKEKGKYIAAIPDDCRVFSFPFDQMNSGILSIMATNSRCKDFAKISVNDIWAMCTMPKTNNVFFCQLGNNLVFYNVTCDLKKITVIYVKDISSDDDNVVIPTVMELRVLSVGLQYMIAAREGKVLDMSIDSNPNAVTQMEVNRQNLKG